MFAVAIFAFLSGAVLGGTFRVWVLIPVTLLAFVVALASEIWQGDSLLLALGVSVAIAIAPQLGFAFALAARAVLTSSSFRHSPDYTLRQQTTRINDAEAR